MKDPAKDIRDAVAQEHANDEKQVENAAGAARDFTGFFWGMTVVLVVAAAIVIYLWLK